MAVLKRAVLQQWLQYGFCLYLLLSCSCSDKSAAEQKAVARSSSNSFHVDTLHSACNADEMFRCEWGYGIHMLQFKSCVYSVVLKSPRQFYLYDIRYKDVQKMIDLDSAITTFYTTDSTLFYITKDGARLCEVSFGDHTLGTYKTSNVSMPGLFNDSLFIAANIMSPVVALNSKEILIPFRARNGTVNLLDTCAYLRLNVGVSEAAYAPLVKFPAYMRTQPEYYWRPLSIYAPKINKLFYNFQKWDKLYALDLKTGIVDSVVIKDFHAVPYDNKKKQSSITYIRNYMLLNDCNIRLFCDSDARIYLLKKNRKDNL